MDSFENQFIYVDGYYAKPDGRSSPWKRIKISEIPNLKKKADNFNVFVTAQKFCSPQRTEDELIWGDLYFDLDASEQYPINVDSYGCPGSELTSPPGVVDESQTVSPMLNPVIFTL